MNTITRSNWKTKQCTEGRKKNEWTVKQLRQYLRAHKLKVSGKKAELCSRVDAHIMQQQQRGLVIPNIIDGPVSMYVYHLKKKLVILFGDSHTQPKYMCSDWGPPATKFPDFLQKLFLESRFCVDFFFETKYIPKESTAKPFKSTEDIMINDVRNQFQDCLTSVSKDKCQKYGNVRMHYVDIRHHDLPQEQVNAYYLYPSVYKSLRWFWNTNFKKKLSQREVYMFHEINKSLNAKETVSVIKYIIGLTNVKPNVSVFARKDIETMRRLLDKQLNVLPVNLKKKIQHAFAKDLDENISYLLNIAKSSFNSMAMSQYAHKLDISSVNVILFARIPIILMDTYLMARLFKLSLKDGKLAIIYAGAEHIENYSNFLNNNLNGSIEVFKKPMSMFRVKCIKIPDSVVTTITKITSEYPTKQCSMKKKS